MFQPIKQLWVGIRVVDDHENGPDPTSCEKKGHVLLAVASHNSNPIASLDSLGQETTRQPIGLLVELGICPSSPGPWHDQCFRIAISQTLELEQFTKGHVPQRLMRWALDDRKLFFIS